MESALGAQEAQGVEEAPRLGGGVRLAVVGALMLTLLLEALDATVVGTAMPRVMAELGGLDRFTWVATIYLLGSTTVIPIAGKLSDQFGRKWFLIGGTALFLVGSALCGAAQTIDQLIIFRAIQGVGGGAGIALVFTAVADIFPPAERARWQGTVGTVYAVASVIGPTFGGWVADNGPLVWPVLTDSSRWRWVFYVNLPLGIVALLGLLFWLPADISVRSSDFTGWAAVKRIDFVGSVLAFAATACLFLGLTWGGDNDYSWTSPQVVIVLGAALLLYGLLIYMERRAVEPILPLELFRNRLFTADTLLWVFQFMALLGMAFYVPLFIQRVLNASATESGATMTAFSLSIPIAGFLAGNAVGIFKRHQIFGLLGTLIMTVGIVLLLLMTPSSSLIYVAVAVAVSGFGMGMISPVVFTVAQNALQPTQLGAGTGVVRYLGQLGGSIGVALVGAVVNSSIAAGLGLDIAINHGLLLVLAFCVAAFLAACFVRESEIAKL